jgi:hypothetical protein
MGWTAGVQTDSGAHPASFPMGTEGFHFRGKADGVCQSQELWSYTSTPTYVSMK